MKNILDLYLDFKSEYIEIGLDMIPQTDSLPL